MCAQLWTAHRSENHSFTKSYCHWRFVGIIMCYNYSCNRETVPQVHGYTAQLGHQLSGLAHTKSRWLSVCCRCLFLLKPFACGVDQENVKTSHSLSPKRPKTHDETKQFQNVAGRWCHSAYQITSSWFKNVRYVNCFNSQSVCSRILWPS